MIKKTLFTFEPFGGNLLTETYLQQTRKNLSKTFSTQTKLVQPSQYVTRKYSVFYSDYASENASRNINRKTFVTVNRAVENITRKSAIQYLS